MNEKINELYNKLDAQDEIIEQLELENASLKKDKKKAIEYMKTLSDEYAANDYDIKCVVFNKLYYEILGDKENE